MDALLDFENEIRSTTFESFALLPKPYPVTDEEWENFVTPPELELAVKKVQNIIISVVRKRYKDLIKYNYLDATATIYHEIAGNLRRAAGHYGIGDTASREEVCYRIGDFFKKVCICQCQCHS